MAGKFDVLFCIRECVGYGDVVTTLRGYQDFL